MRIRALGGRTGDGIELEVFETGVDRSPEESAWPLVDRLEGALVQRPVCDSAVQDVVAWHRLDLVELP